MKNQISELIENYLLAVRTSKRLHEEIVEAIRAADRQLMNDDEVVRRGVLKKLQRDFYILHLAELLRDLPAYAGCSQAQLQEYGETILNKRQFNLSNERDPEGRRTLAEQRYFGLARVRWYELMKAAGLKPIDARGSSRPLRKLGRREF
ncbi:hypothetical protein H9L13_02910 [Sphingomonas lutea]|uniref:Uncharacterized protein n=1 Tax=Sphingomonas lutea TaxID=1045317 RepID=A0A7G9SJ64_9SPHN|nr:hypothetical protein [Sphingomonas lutea]QNN67889.1 hypothetical protein H9L13_02910 [Sphingomonas lutea]